MGFLKEILFRRPKVIDTREVIPAEAFEVTSVRPRFYSPFETVTRSVFCSWLLQSFAESRGYLPLQADYIHLTGLNTNHDMQKSLQNFAYGTHGVFAPWNRLTRGEQRSMTDAYSKLMKVEVSNIKLIDKPLHKGLYVHQHIDVGARFNVQIRYLIDRLDPKCVNLISPTAGMSIYDFRKRVEPHLKVYPRG